MTIKSILITLAALAIALPTPLHAAKAAKKEGKADRKNRPGVVLRGYDTNKSKTIDGDEIAALRKAYEDEKTGPLKQFDTNNDGSIDDTEIAALKTGHKKKDKAAKTEKGGKKKKKNA